MQKKALKLVDTEKSIKIMDFSLIFAIFSSFLLKFHLILNQKIAWDEFYFLSKVFLYKEGTLFEPFQNFHVHLLQWVDTVSKNEISQVIFARSALFIFFVLSGILIFKISRHFLTRTGALFAVFCWLAFSNVIEHGASLRYDSFCSFFFLLACHSLLKKSGKKYWAAIAGVAMGVSLLVSLKAAIHVIALITLLTGFWLIKSEKAPTLLETVSFLTFMIVTFATGFLIHKGLLQPPVQPVSQNFVSHASSKAIIFNTFFPQFGYFSDTLRKNPVVWWLLAVGVFYVLFDFKKSNQKEQLIALAFLVPLCSLPFYRNAFPYFYTFIMAPACLFCGILPNRMLHNFQNSKSIGLLFIVALLFVSVAAGAGFHFKKAFQQTNHSQAQLFTVIHRMFPQPVHYIDGCSAVSSFPQVGFFMSTWGFENYLSQGRPIFRKILIKKRPEFLLANTPHLDLDIPRNMEFFKLNYDFFEEDTKTLRDNFVNFWGMVWLPGKNFYFKSKDEQHHFEILIPGLYSIHGKSDIYIDGKHYQDNDKLYLSQGFHKIETGTGKQSIKILWAKLNFIPEERPPEISTFYGF